MTIATFSPPLTPSIGLVNKPEIKVLRADFGDGYTQATRDGMNNIRAVYDVKWDVLTLDEADAIVTFFEAQGGADAFFYAIPGTTTPVKWTCEAWTDQFISGGFKTVTATFRQSFTLDA